MTLTSEQVAPHMNRFLDMLDDAFQRYGLPDGLPERFREAVAATPRHLFVHRFRLIGGSLGNKPDIGLLRDSDTDPVGELSEIYSDEVMNHVNAAGEQLPSTNSQPSYVLWLLHLLDLQPGQRVLEIGSGSGWLAAVVARLVGEDGRVTGIEIIPELAMQSQTDLARLGVSNVAVLATDGAQGDTASAPFDRVMITAASWDLSAVLFDQVVEGGQVLVPVELRGGGCQVTVLRRQDKEFVAEHAVPGWFVPLLGQEQQRPRMRHVLAELPFWREIGGVAPQRIPLPLATGVSGTADSTVAAFRAFLGRITTSFAILGSDELLKQSSVEPFGIVDEAERSVAIWSGGELLGYGSTAAMRSLTRAYASWASFGLPGLAGLGLRVVKAGDAPIAGDTVWVEKRGGTALVWCPLPHAEGWKEFLADAL